MDFIFWWSIISTVLGIILLIASIWQYHKREKTRAQIKVWMENVHGLAEGLKRIVRDNLDKRYSSTDDVCNAVWSIEASASSLYQSLYEERCVTEKEYKSRQKRLAGAVEDQQMSHLKNKQPQDSISDK